jgi:integrase
LSVSSVRSTLAQCRAFFQWLAVHPKGIRKVDGTAAAYLQLSNNDERAGRATREGPVPTLEQVRAALMAMPATTDVERRNRAIVAFTALTGVRDAALISLRLGDVDVQKREVWQNPRHVRTKNRKGIVTFFMPFDPLWEEVTLDWLAHARGPLGLTDKDPLFPKEALANDPATLSFRSAGLAREPWANATPVRAVFKAAFAAANLTYFRPHSFRKMIVRWAMAHCTQLQVKAISQNLGHAHTMTTYNAYGNIPVHDQAKAIASIGQGADLDLSTVPQEAFMAEVARRMGG